MQYVGGKQKSGGQHIAAAIRQYCAHVGTEHVVEPFCGGLSVTYRLRGLRVQASDACVALITLYNAMHLDEWMPPAFVERETWQRYKDNPDPSDPMTAFVGFGCSRSGAWFSSFVHDYKYTKRRVPAATAARDSLLRKLGKCGDVTFAARDYAQSPVQGVWYCDIPYSGTVGYPAVGAFDHERFWVHARTVSEHVPVLVSELQAPEDFSVYAEWSVQGRLNTPNGQRRVERLFVHARWAGVVPC